MKLILKQTPLNLLPLCILFFMSSCSSNDDAVVNEPTQVIKAAFLSPTCLYPITDEPKFNLNAHPVSEPQGNFEISEFNMNTIYAVSGASLPFKIDVILNEHFCALKDSANSLRQSSPIYDSTATALKMRFGLNATKDSILVLYQPVALISPTVVADTIRFTVYEGSNPNYYSYSEAGFAVISSTAACKSYTSFIQLKHKQSEAPSGFKAGHDVESILFSFQEIGQLIYDNQTDSISVWNAIGKKPGMPPNDSSLYHSILLGPEALVGPFVYYGPFPNKFANLAHLCPPSCDKVGFRLLHD